MELQRLVPEKALELALSYNNERFKERVQGFADEFGAGQVIKLEHLPMNQLI